MCAAIEQQLEQFQDRLQYRFSDLSLLRQAMVHRSYLNEANDPGLESNERLEFLGDAVLGAIVAQHLYAEFPRASEGWMTVARSQLVRNDTLGIIGRDIGLGPCLLLGAGIANDGARERTMVLSRALEAVFGAIRLDGGEEAVRGVVLRLLEPNLAVLVPDEFQADSKSLLQELTQSQSGAQPEYSIVDQYGPPHDRSFRAAVTVDGARLAVGQGRSKQAAEKDAASRALASLRERSA
jgi:ribonuclease-3